MILKRKTIGEKLDNPFLLMVCMIYFSQYLNLFGKDGAL